MIALSIRQPWAWLIVNGFKNVENRTWKTPFRGEFLVHAGKTKNKQELSWAIDFVRPLGIVPVFRLGGIVGTAKITDCVEEMEENYWFHGPYGFVIE